MTCEEVRERISARLDGELSPEADGDVEEHLASCEACRAWKAEATALDRLVGEALVPEPPPGWGDDLLDRVRDEIAGPEPVRTTIRPWALAGLAAAAAILAAFFLWPTDPGPGPSPSVAIDESEVLPLLDDLRGRLARRDDAETGSLVEDVGLVLEESTALAPEDRAGWRGLAEMVREADLARRLEERRRVIVGRDARVGEELRRLRQALVRLRDAAEGGTS